MRWYHSYPELGIKGLLDPEHIPFVSTVIPEDLTGKTVLDIGAFDGVYSFIAAKRGAKVVLACDMGLGEQVAFNQTLEDSYEKYDLVRNKTGWNVHFAPLSAVDIDKLAMQFDVVFAFGVYYHLRDPLGFFEKCYNITKEMLLVEGEVMLWDKQPPNLAAFYNAEEPFHNDNTNYYVPTIDCLLRWLMRAGFKKPEVVGLRGTRVLVRASKVEE
jgi:tRNA (mo5U34)-methyltransferase